MKRFYVIVEGRVQGVGFRGFATQIAREMGLTGTVRNMSNGMVEIYVQGEEMKIDAFLDIIKRGNHFIRVDSISTKEVPLEIGEKRFSYIF